MSCPQWIAWGKEGTFPSSQRRGGCAEQSEGADGVVSSAKHFGRADHPGASRHPSSARRRIVRHVFYAVQLLVIAAGLIHAQQNSYIHALHVQGSVYML